VGMSMTLVVNCAVAWDARAIKALAITSLRSYMIGCLGRAFHINGLLKAGPVDARVSNLQR
jgi:hypothetical protein